MAKGIINLIRTPFITEASGGKAGETSSYKRRLAGQGLLPLVGRTRKNTPKLCVEEQVKRNIPGTDFFFSWCLQEARGAI